MWMIRTRSRSKRQQNELKDIYVASNKCTSLGALFFTTHTRTLSSTSTKFPSAFHSLVSKTIYAATKKRSVTFDRLISILISALGSFSYYYYTAFLSACTSSNHLRHGIPEREGDAGSIWPAAYEVDGGVELRSPSALASRSKPFQEPPCGGSFGPFSLPGGYRL